MEEPDHGELDPAARLPRRWPRFTALRAGRGKLDFAGHGELNAAGHGELDLAGWRSLFSIDGWMDGGGLV